MTPVWVCGVTTCTERRYDLLPKTLKSIDKAGFPTPRLFVDGMQYEGAESEFDPDNTTFRSPRLRPWANWIASLMELYLRNPKADRYAMFQDDVQFYPYLREYLDALPLPSGTYWNLITSHENNHLIQGAKVGFTESSIINHNSKYQSGRGALALVFPHEGVMTLLTSAHAHGRPQDPVNGWKSIDGGVVTSMNIAGWRELIHNPSLVNHAGDVSTIITIRRDGSEYRKTHPKPMTWRSETFDARQLLAENPLTRPQIAATPSPEPETPSEPPPTPDAVQSYVAIPGGSPVSEVEPVDEGKLGDHVKEMLSRIGVTEEAVSAWLGAPCNCDERRAKLNALDAWWRRMIRTGASRAKEFLQGLMG